MVQFFIILIMKVVNLSEFSTLILILMLLLGRHKTYAQGTVADPIPSFWSKVRFGGNLSASFGKNRTNIVVAPSAIYTVSQKFNAGLGLNLGYNQGLNFEDYIYGLRLISLYTPFQGLQLSAEFEETGVTRTLSIEPQNIRESYWYPSIFVGAGYQMRGITIGVRYDLLYDENKSVYATAFNPFVRVFF